MTDEREGLLAGLRVLEFGQIAAGPFAGLLLADLGADVVKVEHPGTGDRMREWPPHFVNLDGQTYSANFAALNRNKRSIALDLKDADQLKLLRRLCRQADVIIENFRPGVLKRYGFGYEELVKDHPGLVYCSISGYGQNNPFSDQGAFDVTIQAISGLMSVTGEEDGPPVKCGVPVGDFVTGLYAALAIVAAVSKVKQSGKGCHIDCSMLGSVLGISALQTSEYFCSGAAPQRLGTAHPRNAPYQGFQAKDQPFVIAAGTQKLWNEVCEAVGLPDLYKDPRFATQHDRVKNQRELANILQTVFRTKPAEEWLGELRRRGVPCAPIHDYAQALSSPEVAALELIEELPLPNHTVTKTVTFPVKISEYAGPPVRRPPKIGEHQEGVFRDWLGEEIGR